MHVQMMCESAASVPKINLISNLSKRSLILVMTFKFMNKVDLSSKRILRQAYPDHCNLLPQLII